MRILLLLLLTLLISCGAAVESPPKEVKGHTWSIMIGGHEGEWEKMQDVGTGVVVSIPTESNWGCSLDKVEKEHHTNMTVFSRRLFCGLEDSKTVSVIACVTLDFQNTPISGYNAISLKKGDQIETIMVGCNVN